MDFSQGVPYTRVSNLIKRFPVAQHIHVETKDVPADKSLFHNCIDPREFNKITLELGQDEMNKNRYVAPYFYIWYVKDGLDMCRMMNVQAMIDFDPDLLQASMEMMVREMDSRAYALLMRCWVSKTHLFKLRSEPSKQVLGNPNHPEALVSYCDFKNGDRSYVTHTYGQVDDVIFWEPTQEEREIPPHYIPGRLWRLFERPVTAEEEEGEEE